MQEFLVEAIRHQHPTSPDRIVLDLDAADDPIHGHQLGKFFHGYYNCDCYLLLYVFPKDGFRDLAVPLELPERHKLIGQQHTGGSRPAR